VFHGNGGFDYHTVYNMPIWLRNFTLNQISSFNKKQNEAVEKASKGKNQSSTNMGDPVPEHMKSALKQSKHKSSYTTQKAKK